MQDLNFYSFQLDVYVYGVVFYEFMIGLLFYSYIGCCDQIIFMVGCGYLFLDFSKIFSNCFKVMWCLLFDCFKFQWEEWFFFFQILVIIELL